MMVVGQYERHCPECEGTTWHIKDTKGQHIQWKCRACGNVSDCTVADLVAEACKAPEPICEATMDRIRKNVQDAILTDGTDDLLAERERTHGDFGRTSRYAQDLKRVATAYVTSYSISEDDPHNPNGMNDRQRESFDLICTKLARILAGDPHVDEHWLDIEGYARLARQPAD